jgi:hypothetical protein
MIEGEVRQARVSHRLAHLLGRRHRDLVPARDERPRIREQRLEVAGATRGREQDAHRRHHPTPASRRQRRAFSLVEAGHRADGPSDGTHLSARTRFEHMQKAP